LDKVQLTQKGSGVVGFAHAMGRIMILQVGFERAPLQQTLPSLRINIYPIVLLRSAEE
jgi:hypothetical protein